MKKMFTRTKEKNETEKTVLHHIYALVLSVFVLFKNNPSEIIIQVNTEDWLKLILIRKREKKMFLIKEKIETEKRKDLNLSLKY